MGSRSNYIKTKYAGLYYTEDPKTKVKTYIARIKVSGIIDTEQVVGHSNDIHKTNAALAYQKLKWLPYFKQTDFQTIN